MPELEKPKVTNVFLYSIMLGMLLTGTANTIVGKYLDLTKAPKIPESEGCYLFTHPYI